MLTLPQEEQIESCMHEDLIRQNRPPTRRRHCIHDQSGSFLSPRLL